MALTRARVVTAPDGLRHKIDAIISASLTRNRDPGELVRDVAKMRLRIAQEHKGRSIWDIKHRRGGLVDIEFLAQYLMLRHGAEHPDILSQNTSDALSRLTAAGLLAQPAAEEIQDTLHCGSGCKAHCDFPPKVHLTGTALPRDSAICWSRQGMHPIMKR